MKHVCIYLGALTLSVVMTAAPTPAQAHKDEGKTPAAAETKKAERGHKDFVQVNINSADAKALSKALLRVGKKRAAAIVAYRDEHGPFEAAEDLAKVKGISKRIVKLNADRILLQDSEEAATDNQAQDP